MPRPINLVPEDILAFVKKEIPSYKGELTVRTRIGEDLRLIGDDADEFLGEFSKEFDVDLSGLPFSEYFPGEGSADMHFYTARQMRECGNPSLLLFRGLDSLIRGLFKRRSSFKTMTVQDLYETACAGKWGAKC